MVQNLWTREQLILALNLYLKLPFGKLHSRTPEIIQLAKLIGRTPGAVAMRLNNFASVDPFHQQRGITGLPGGRRQVEPIWDEFVNNKEELLYESERMLAEREKQTIENKFSEILAGADNLEGETRVREVKTRVNQHIFRQMVISNYSGKCAISGIDIQELLIASHIIPWSKDEKNRLNPCNGVCLNALHDKAFDKGLVTITPDYTIKIASSLKKKSSKPLERYFHKYEGKEMILPKRFLPDPDFLTYHNQQIFQQ